MIIYKTTNLVNGKIYIGQDKNNNPDYIGSEFLLKRAVKKYGKENFTKEILDTAASKEELDEKERYWIKELKSQDPDIGYNITNGGVGGDTLSNHPNINEIGRKISVKNSGDKNGFYHKHHSEETKQRMRENSYWKGKPGINTGKKKSPETIEKHRKKLSGVKLKEEHRKNIAKGHIKYLEVHQYSLDWEYIKTYQSINEAASDNNLHGSNLLRAIKSKSHMCGKFRWISNDFPMTSKQRKLHDSSSNS